MQAPEAKVHESVREYYGKVLSSSKDLKTSACCPTEALPSHLKAAVAELHPEVVERFYGCGSPIPSALEGKTVLDLGCGAGRDVYLLSKLVGPKGRVIGVDMTSEQLEVARRHQEHHARVFGHGQSNVTFLQGYIEDLASLGVESESVDVVVSNCVLNLAPDKSPVFREIWRVLRPGGELYFADVFAGRRIPKELASDPVLRGECLGGALYVEDFRRLMRTLGCLDHRVVAKSRLTLSDGALERQVGMIDFWSMTVRAFKLALEDQCEDFGQVATYLGTLPEAPHAFLLDDHHLFETGRPMTVCGNTADMLSATRFAPHFKVVGDKSVHFGLFPCGPAPTTSVAATPAGACC
jgi:SAM-dependent methyltransferase